LPAENDSPGPSAARLVFETIRIDLPRQSIYQRLGYRRDATRISPQQVAEIENYMEEARDLIHLQGTVLRLPIREHTPERVVLGDDILFESRNLARFFAGCQEAAIMGATAGPAIMAAIAEDAAGRNVTRAVVMDATASEMADGALDWIMSYLRGILRKGKQDASSAPALLRRLRRIFFWRISVFFIASCSWTASASHSRKAACWSPKNP